MAKKLTPQQIAQKQIKRAVAAVQDYRDGVNAVTESPTAKAARNLDKYLANTQDAVNSGRMAQALNDTSLQDWQSKAAGKGGDRFAAGVRDAEATIVDFQTQIAPHRDAVQREVNAMPNNSIDDAVRKVEANMRGMARFKYRKGKRS